MAEKEYIERELAKKTFQNGKHTVKWLIESGAKTIGDSFAILLDEVPAADVRPVVLCKECKYRNTDKYGSWCLNDYENNLKDDDFCSRGKRK